MHGMQISAVHRISRIVSDELYFTHIHMSISPSYRPYRVLQRFFFVPNAPLHYERTSIAMMLMTVAYAGKGLGVGRVYTCFEDLKK